MNKIIGAFWKSKPEQQEKGLVASGTIEVIAGLPLQVVLFKNTKKEAGSNQPDFNLVISEVQKDKENGFKKTEAVSL